MCKFTVLLVLRARGKVVIDRSRFNVGADPRVRPIKKRNWKLYRRSVFNYGNFAAVKCQIALNSKNSVSWSEK